MSVLTFDDFSGGLDVRPSVALSKPTILRVLKEAYVTTGKSVKKRPCLEKIATLEAGTVGLKAFGGKLNTFYGAAAAITHADTRFVARRVPHITTGDAPTKIHYCDQYNALMYVAAEYADGTFRHHYLDGGTGGATTGSATWATATAYAVGSFKVPTVQNGFRYEVTAIAGTGTSGGVEPTWPTTLGATVVDNPGANQITWTCRTFAVADSNCPHTKEVAKQAEKMFAKGVDATTVRFCKTGDPRDWTTASDAGFLPVGLYARGSDQVTGIGIYQKKGLVVFFSDNTQVWTVDPDPDNHALTSNIEGVGSLFHRAAGPVSQDLFFLAQPGYRSVSTISITDNLQETDVGSPVDALIKATIDSTDDPIALYYPKLGQFWSMNGTKVWIYSFSRVGKLSAWSENNLAVSGDDITVLNQELYIRSGDDVYKVSDAVYKDGADAIPLVDVQMYYQDGKKPGVLKQFTGMDVIGTGQPTVSFKYFSEDGAELETSAYEFPSMTEAGLMQPVELLATRIAPHFTHQKDEPFELAVAMLHYESLGVR